MDATAPTEHPASWACPEILVPEVYLDCPAVKARRENQLKERSMEEKDKKVNRALMGLTARPVPLAHLV